MVALVLVVTLTFAGCGQSLNRENESPSRTITAKITFTPPEGQVLGEWQKAATKEHPAWRYDAFAVARADFVATVKEPPESLDPQALKALQLIDPKAVAKNEAYQIYYDAAKQTHVVFTAPPFEVDATMASAKPQRDLPPIWITRNVVLSRR